jgi:hypothetical protein
MRKWPVSRGPFFAGAQGISELRHRLPVRPDGERADPGFITSRVLWGAREVMTAILLIASNVSEDQGLCGQTIVR